MVAEKSGLTWKSAYIFIGILGVCLMIRSFFGIDSTDESFYFAVARRFSQGDVMLVDEWFPAQMIGFLLLPFYRLYVLLNGGQEGIILCARLCYVAFALLTAVYMMRVFCRRGESVLLSFLSSVLFATYARGGIATFSYYNIGLLTMLLTMLFLLDAKNARVPAVKWFLAGVSFSISAICMPYMVIFFLCMVVYYLLCRKRLSVGKDGIFLMAGVLFSAGLFLLFFGNALLEGLSNLQYIFQNPQHQGGILDKTGGTILYILFTYLKYTWPLYIVSFLAAFFLRRAKAQEQRALRCFKIFSYLLFFTQAVYSRTFFEGGIVCAFLLLALQIQMVSPGIREQELERYFLLPGILFGFCWMNGSNLGMRAFDIGVLLADVWALKILWQDAKLEGRSFRGLRNASAAILFLVLLANRFFDVYRDSVIWKMDTQVSCGSMKGIFTSAQRAKEYEAVIGDLNRYTRADDRLAVQGLNPWVYLESPARCGSLSVWRVDSGHEMHWAYYKKYPQNIPTVVYLLSADRAQYKGWRWGSNGDASQGDGLEQPDGYFKELLDNSDCAIQKTGTGIFYRLKK